MIEQEAEAFTERMIQNFGVDVRSTTVFNIELVYLLYKIWKRGYSDGYEAGVKFHDVQPLKGEKE